MQKQQSRKKPCKSCPFRRDNDLQKPNPRGSPPEVYLGQIRGPFILPCQSYRGFRSYKHLLEVGELKS